MHPKALLLLVVFASLIGCSLLLLGLTGIPQIIVGTLQGFVWPTYALSVSIFPNRQLGLLRFVLALGMTLALTVIGGFILNIFPTGLDTSAWAVFTTIVTLVAAGLAYQNERHTDSQPSTTVRARFRVRNWIIAAATLLIVGAAIELSQYGAENQSREGFTQLWLVALDRTDPTMLRLGIRNEEHTVFDYRLELYVDSAVVYVWESIELQHGDQWETTWDFSTIAHNGNRIEAILYQSDAPAQVYRRVTWTIQAVPGKAATNSQQIDSNQLCEKAFINEQL